MKDAPTSRPCAKVNVGSFHCSTIPNRSQMEVISVLFPEIHKYAWQLINDEIKLSKTFLSFCLLDLNIEFLLLLQPITRQQSRSVAGLTGVFSSGWQGLHPCSCSGGPPEAPARCPQAPPHPAHQTADPPAPQVSRGSRLPRQLLLHQSAFPSQWNTRDEDVFPPSADLWNSRRCFFFFFLSFHRFAPARGSPYPSNVLINTMNESSQPITTTSDTSQRGAWTFFYFLPVSSSWLKGRFQRVMRWTPTKKDTESF